ncbi:DMT family transporter [Paenibacillus xylaniclasticus]|uniref:DMT family transporter n=1 Tax=Paenibacillus xylaniclasticus TaxID=588083 RepID=UPI000FDBF4BC|nr:MULTISPECIES: DMT family transporter [Paenibacillus]GFN33884.1 transporter [Paenibacillus curdlanolyticus]
MNAKRFFTHPAGIATGSVGSTMLWGSAYPTLKRSYEELGIDGTDWFEQFLFAGYRFTLAGLLIFLFMIVVKEPLRYRDGSMGTIVRLGMVQTVLQYVFFYSGMAHSSGVFGAVIAGTISFFSIILAHLTDPADRLTRHKMAGLLLGLLGLLMLALPRGMEEGWSHAFGFGELLLLASAFCAGLGNLISKKAVANLPVTYVNSYQMLFGGLILIALGGSVAGWSPFHWTAAALWLLLYAAVISSAGFVLWNYVMKYNSVGSTASFLFLTPVFGVILSSIFLNETIGIAVIASLTSVSMGIILVNRKLSKKITVEVNQAAAH